MDVKRAAQSCGQAGKPGRPGMRSGGRQPGMRSGEFKVRAQVREQHRYDESERARAETHTNNGRTATCGSFVRALSP